MSVFDTSRKHISEMFSIHAHSQGVSQVYFVSDTKFITGGNDSSAALWDLSKLNDQPDGQHIADRNGQTSPIHDRNIDVTEACKIADIQHESKINWLKPVCINNQNFIIIADQTLELTLLPFA